MTRSTDDQAGTGRRRFLRNAAGGMTAGAAVVGVSQAYGNLPAPADRQLRAAGVNYRDIADNHSAHIPIFFNLAGPSARPKPTFQNLQVGNVNTFYSRSTYFENFYVAACKQACPILGNPVYRDWGTAISLVLARHAGWLNTVMAFRLTANAAHNKQEYEGTFTQTVIVNAYSPYIANLNGGPPMSFNPTTTSGANDNDAINFLFAISYLEQEFYSLNVPIFFPA